MHQECLESNGASSGGHWTESESEMMRHRAESESTDSSICSFFLYYGIRCNIRMRYMHIYIYIYIYACVFQGEAIDVHAIMRDEWREEARGTSTGLDCWRREFREREREPNWVLALFRKAAKRAATVVFHLFQFPDTSQTMENVLPRDGGDGHRHNSPLCHRRCNVMSANALKGPRGKCVQKAIVPPVKQVYESFF
jgi:hypothetical protein